MLTWIRKWELLTRPWRWFESRVFHDCSFWKWLFFLRVTSVIAVATHLSWFHAWSKYIKKSVTVLLSYFWWYYSSLRLPMPLSCSLGVNALLLPQGQCFPESWIWSRTSFGKMFLIKTLEYASFLSKEVPPLPVSWLYFPCHMCFCVSRGVENWIALKGQAEENWLVLTSAHSSSTRRENFKFWNLLFSY